MQIPTVYLHKTDVTVIIDIVVEIFKMQNNFSFFQKTQELKWCSRDSVSFHWNKKVNLPYQGKNISKARFIFVNTGFDVLDSRLL